MPDLPEHLLAERDHLIAEIHAAFKNVRRGNGVSWLETEVLDDFGTEEERREARLEDPERPWQHLVQDPKWLTNTAWGGWAFLDAEGFRYYLPAGLMREVRNDPNTTSDICFFLEFPEPAKDPKRDLREHTLKQWSMLDDRQRRCVKRFIEFKVACARAHHDAETDALGWDRYDPVPSDWQTALDSYWASIPDA